MKPTFEWSVNVLVKAYLNNTLQVGNYCACAIGNLLAEKLGARLYLPNLDAEEEYGWDHSKYYGNEWFDLIVSLRSGRIKTPDDNEGLEQIAKLGYSIPEVIKIERAFERCGRISELCTHEDIEAKREQAMFNGLMAAVDALAEIHGVDLTVKEEAKKLFVK